VTEVALVTVDADTQVTDLVAGDHACLTFGEPEEMLDLMAAFARDGLATGLRVVLVSDLPELTAPGLGRRGVDTVSGPGQVVAAAWHEGLVRPGGFSAGRAMRWLAGHVTATQRAGYAGLRVALDMSWALRPVTGIEQLPELEEQLAVAACSGGLTVLCGYDRERFDPVTLAAVAPSHSQSVAAPTYYADPLLRICRQYTPPGVRVAGELDYQAAEPLALALAEALRIDGDITLNMTGLSMIDAPCLRMVMDTARSLAPPRRMVLQAPAAVRARFAQFGADQLPQVQLVASDDR
jgi:anti-anti-sigma regulatory factor